MVEKPEILIVEDDAIASMDVAKMIHQFGYQITNQVATGEDAVKSFEKKRSDLVIMDINLKGEMNGIEAASYIHHEYDVPVIFLTAYTDKDIIQQAKTTDPFGYIRKPFTESDLWIAMELAFNQYRIVSELKETHSFLHEITRLFVNSSYYMNIDNKQYPEPAWIDQAGLFDMAGYTPQQIKQKGGWRNIIHADDVKYWDQHVDKLIRKKSNTIEYRIVSRSGDEILLKDVGRSMWNDLQESAVRIIGAVQQVDMSSALTAAEPDHKNDTLYLSPKILKNMVYECALMRQIEKNIVRMSKSSANVLVFGESGTGKELLARSIHQNSKRRDQAFIPIDCVALPPALLESELFGYEKGAFTGAVKTKPGVLELAEGGTLFLDEITEMEPVLQAKLLRVLQERQFRRIGGKELIDIDIRVISATNQNPEAAVKAQTFREDLYYRLNVIPIYLPPLRERKEDIPLLVHHFINKYHPFSRVDIQGISDRSMQILKQYHWPGNVRELENVIQRAMSLADHNLLQEKDLPEKIRHAKMPNAGDSTDMGYKEAKAQYIKQFCTQYVSGLLKKYQWNISKVAKIAGVSRVTLYRMIDDCGLER